MNTNQSSQHSILAHSIFNLLPHIISNTCIKVWSLPHTVTSKPEGLWWRCSRFPWIRRSFCYCFCSVPATNGFLAVPNHDHRLALHWAEVLSVEVQVEREGEEEARGTGLGLGEGTDLGDGLVWQLLGSASSFSLPPPLLFPPPAPCPSSPSEFSSISWMRGGMEPGISIFSVITRSAPIRQS